MMGLVIDISQGILILVGAHSWGRRMWRYGILGWMVPQWWLNKREAKQRAIEDRMQTTLSEGVEYKTYGHPVAPVKHIHDCLPKPPSGHAWEIKTEDYVNEGNSSPSIRLVVSLVNVGVLESAGEAVISTIEKDLLYYHSRQTWVSFYEEERNSRYPRGDYSMFRRYFSDSVFEWAKQEKATIETKLRAANGGGEYLLRGA